MVARSEGIQVAGLPKGKGLKKQAVSKTVEQVAAESVRMLLEDNKLSGDISDYIIGEVKDNMNKREAVVNEFVKQLDSKNIAQDDYKDMVADIKVRLGLTTSSTASEPAKAEAPAAVEAAAPAVPTAKVISVKPTGIKGDDGTPQYTITIKISGLPATTRDLSGYIHTNKDWDAGYSESHVSGMYKFTAYLANPVSNFVIKAKDDNGDITRIPASGYITVKRPE